MAEASTGPGGFTTARLAAASGYSAQQVRDLERLGVIPPGSRRPNGYREFGPSHLAALHVYRQLAIAINPVNARVVMVEAQRLPRDEAIARVVALHVELARARDDAIAALEALDSIVEEGRTDAAPSAGDAMSITELAAAIGVRSSALRFWEQQGLVTPDRSTSTGARSYPVAAVRDARIVAALRAGGYRIAAVRAVIESVRSLDPGDARHALEERLRTIAVRSEALLHAGAAIADLISRRDDAARRQSKTLAM